MSVLCVCRHGEREDYACQKRGINYQIGNPRGWDPPLTSMGIKQGKALGLGLKEHLQRLGAAQPTTVVCSPFLRCVQTAAAAASSLGLNRIAIEPGLAEGMLEDWFRSWAVPGADSTWGGPEHSRTGTPLPAEAELHPSSQVAAGTLLLTPAAAADALRQLGVTDVTIDSTYIPIAPDAEFCWGAFESEPALADRMEATLTALATNKFANETILACSHGGPCAHAYRRLLKDSATRQPTSGYTALFVYVRAEDGTWAAPIASDTSHLALLDGIA